MNPEWNEGLLFIIPFELMDKLFDNSKVGKGNLEAVHGKQFTVQHAENKEDMEHIAAFPLSDASKAGLGHSPMLMKIRFRVFDHDVDDEDNFMGSLKIKVKLNADTSGYHEDMQVEKLILQKTNARMISSISVCTGGEIAK